MIQKLFLLFSAGIIILLSFTSAYSELYKYVDEDGVVSYTDDLSNIPGVDKNEVETINEIVSEEPQVQEDVKEEAAVKEPAQTRKDLELMKIELDKEYNACKVEQDKLIEEKAKIETMDEQLAFNEKTKALHKRIEAYNKKSDEYKKMVDNFNKRIIE